MLSEIHNYASLKCPHQHVMMVDDNDYSFISIESSIETHESQLQNKDKDMCSQYSLGGHLQLFGGLAVVPLTALQRLLASSPLTQVEIMKLRSIMRFSVEYHNALVVHSQNLDPLHPVKNFTDRASECFRVFHNIVMAISADNIDTIHTRELCNGFQIEYKMLASLEDTAKQQVECATLRQSVCAVRGEMQDFAVLMTDSILPNL